MRSVAFLVQVERLSVKIVFLVSSVELHVFHDSLVPSLRVERGDLSRIKRVSQAQHYRRECVRGRYPIGIGCRALVRSGGQRRKFEGYRARSAAHLAISSES